MFQKANDCFNITTKANALELKERWANENWQSKIRVRTDEAGIDTKKTGRACGVSRATLNYINGGKSCSDEVGHKIAAALKVPLEKLLEK